MAVAELELPVAKKADTSIRVDAETAEVLRKVAALKDMSIGEYLRLVALPIARRDLISEGKKLARGDKSGD